MESSPLQNCTTSKIPQSKLWIPSENAEQDEISDKFLDPDPAVGVTIMLSPRMSAKVFSIQLGMCWRKNHMAVSKRASLSNFW